MLLAFIPVLIYKLFISVTLPWRTVSFKKMFGYFFIGMSSVLMLLIFFRFFPSWQQPIFPSWRLFGDEYDSLIIMAFIQVAMMEEFVKFLAFKIGDKLLPEVNPVSTMFYCGVSALGFAYVENIRYISDYGMNVIVVRSIFSMYLHFLAGCLMGYWIALSKLPNKKYNRSYYDFIVSKHSIIKNIFYYITGLILAILTHGLFDFALFTESDISDTFLIIMVASLSVYFSYLNLNNISKKLKR